MGEMLSAIGGAASLLDDIFHWRFRKKKKITREEKPIRVTKAGWYDPEVIKPNPGQKCRIDCGEHGERNATYLDPRFMLVWTLTDCTHPAANMNMSESYIQGWKPIDKDAIITEDAEYEEIKPLLITN